MSTTPDNTEAVVRLIKRVADAPVVDVCTATQCAFIPMTPVPREWAGKKVRLVLDDGSPSK